MFIKNQLVEIHIDTISNDGSGVGRYDGKVVFVQGAAVGDFLQIKIIKEKENYAYGRIDTIISPGAGRQNLDCPIGDICGGCCFRHLTYEAELEAKESFVGQALTQIGKIQADCQPILPSPQINRYRNKVQYPITAAENQPLQYGFYAKRSHRVVPCFDCLLQPTEMNEIAKKMVEILGKYGVSAYNESTQTGVLRHLVLRKGHYTGQIMVCLVLNSRSLPQSDPIVKEIILSFPNISTIVINTNMEKTNVILGKNVKILYGNGCIVDSLYGIPLVLSPHSFSQVNTTGAEILFSVVKKYATPKITDVVLDLFCGCGVIGLSLAANCKKVVGVEVVEQAVQAAESAAKNMGLKNVRFICGDAGFASEKLLAEGIKPNIITVDPPRKGCDQRTLAVMLQLAPERIVMVSCNPSTMARDVGFLSANGYTVQKVQPVDMFPRTQHVETCVLLSHKKSQASSPSL